MKWNYRDSMFNLDLQGLDRLEAKLKLLPIRMRNKALRKALTAGVKIVQDEAIRRAPVGKVTTGWMAFLDDPSKPKLKDNIKSKVTVTGKRAWGRVGIDYTKVRHGHLAEFGVKPHDIFLGKGYRARKIRHPGFAGTPYMQKSFETKGDEAVNKMANMLFDAVVEGLKW